MKKILISCLLWIASAACQNTTTASSGLQTLYNRKVGFVIQDGLVAANQVPLWMGNFSAENGTWKDVDYTTGCLARRANWPAQQHFNRIVTLASQYYTNRNSSLLSTISTAMDYWFDNNYAPDSCLDAGGVNGSSCPCGTPGFWNTNWFGQMILMPKVISNTCLLLKGNLTATQFGNCTLVSQRVYDRIDTNILTIGPMTGANMLDSATIVLNLGLLTDNAITVNDALRYFYNQTLVIPEVGADGIKIDGSYLQHLAQLYTGNYGKDYINSVVNVYSQTSGTSFTAPPESRSAFATLMNGTEWMIISNNNMSNILWEYSAIGRMVSFKAIDKQASGGVALNFTRIAQSTADWTNTSSLISSITQNLSKLNATTKGQGTLKGTRSFYSSDYLVHRSESYVTTLKSFSTRTTNSECNNDQNPFGFHLSDGSIFSYIDGDEYFDVFAAWDWNLVPGTTVDYGATPFSCNQTQYYGNTTFVGAVTPTYEGGFSSKGGMAVMQYLNPLTGNLRWEKTFYFFPGYYAVQIGPIVSSTSAPIVTTLDQSNLKGDIYVNGALFNNNQPFAKPTNASQQTLWHNKILYTILDPNITLKVDSSSHSVNNWATIGISQGTATQPIFTATLNHSPDSLNGTTSPLSYVAQLGVDSASSTTNIDALVQLVYQDDTSLGKVRGAYNVKDETIALAFWTAGSYNTTWGLSVTTNQPILTFFTKEKDGYTLTVSDPTQLLTTVNITTTTQNATREYGINLPQFPVAGSSVSIHL